jgi:predicted nucleic acid-binding protein
MKVVIDSSALVKRYIEEPGSQALEEILEDASELGLSIILTPEAISAFNRLLREGRISAEEYTLIKMALLEDVRDATVLQITPEVIAYAVMLLEKNVLRSLDALHVACALAWRTELFVTADKRQMQAAINAGLQTHFVGVA